MKVVLANLPWNVFLKSGVRAGSRWPHLKGPTEKDYLPFPFFLAYAAALLKKNSFDVTLIDAIADEISYGYFLKRIHKIKPDILVCETSTVTLNHDLKLLSKVDRSIPIALCGPDVNIRKPVFLKDYGFIKYVLVGEYEFTLLELVTHLNQGKSLSQVAGLIYRQAQEIRANPLRSLTELDKLPWPLRQELPMHRYNDTPGDMPIPSVQMYASRGCPYKCKFCLWPQVMYQGNHYRTRNVDDVVDEMEYLVKEMHFKSVYFDDDTFNIGKERMLELCDKIKKRKLNIPWAIMARADLMNEEMLRAMRDAGLFAVKYGVESAAQEQLDSINKNMDIKKTQEIVRLTKKLGIRTHLTFTFGLPGETKESIQRTIDLSLKLDPATIQFSLATPFPGTVFYQELKEKGLIISEDWSQYDGNYKSVVASQNITKKDLEFAIKSAYRQWGGHCLQKDRLKKLNYFRLMSKSLKKHGFFITLFKILRNLAQHSVVFFNEKVRRRQIMEEKINSAGIKVGRLTLLFCANNLELYWEGMKLTRGSGFSSLFYACNASLQQLAAEPWNFEKISESEILLTRGDSQLVLYETWKIKVVDEKQIDWNVDVRLKEKMEGLTGKVMLILTPRYKTWVDSWGEGRLFSVANYEKVDLRNPNTDFIGFRGRKKLKGQLPTFFLDLSRNPRRGAPVIRNARSIFSARVLEVHGASLNGDLPQVCNEHNLFSLRIKIVEEDFKKRKTSKK